MTTFEQCVAKEAERASSRSPRGDGGTSRAYVAVYERTEETETLSDKQKAERDKTYAMVRTVAERRRRRQPGSSTASGTATTTTTVTTAFGSEATRERLVAAFQADYMCFIGHCESSTTTNMLQQGLVLPAHNTTTTNTNGNNGNNGNSDSDIFTASDLFAITVRTSSLTLLACASAREAHGPGDEPLGLASALLCAGATSVVGTLWKAQLGTAREFLDVFDFALNRSIVRGGGGGGGGDSGGDSGGGGDGDSKGGLVDLAVAVQSAALRLKRTHDGDTCHPYHWAAFVLYGSWFMARGAAEI